MRNPRFEVISAGGIKTQYSRSDDEDLAYEIVDGTLRVKKFKGQTLIRVITYAAGCWRTIDAKWD